MLDQTLFNRLFFILASTIATITFAAGRIDEVTVSAGNVDRVHSIVTLPADPALAGAFQELSDNAGHMVPLQVRPDGRASFVVNDLKAGQSRTYRLLLIKRSEAPKDTAVATSKNGAVTLAVNGKDVLVYRGEKVPPPAGFEPQYARGGYIHPLTTPAGVVVTDDYPPNHKHHHGVWSPWTSTQFEGRKPDFWNMGAKTGTVEFVELGQTWSGRVAAGLVAMHRFVDLTAKPDPKVALNETWQVDAYALGSADKPLAYSVFDWQSTQSCASQSPLVLPKYTYGGLGLRGNRQWDGANGCTFLTSEGKNRENGNGTEAKWVAMGGLVDKKPVYVAILCSPDNFRSPQPVRLHPKEPFICYVPQQSSDFSIEPGKPYVMKYRFIVGDGEPKPEELNKLWADYAEPVKASVK